MNRQEAREEYYRALRLGQREYKELEAAGKDPNPAVLDEILEGLPVTAAQDIGLVEIPAERIVGTKSAGRISAFTAGFLPILGIDSEFAAKWVELCCAHLSDEGIRDPILCYEYLGNFYVQEGNKRVSVLKHFGAPRIPGTVLRILPPMSDEPHIIAYYEFLEFYKGSKLYEVQFRRPGDYAKLLAHLGKAPGAEWTDWERRTFTAYLQYFREAFYSLKGDQLDLRPEEALLLWLQLYSFRDLGKLSSSELKKTLSGLWDDVVTIAQETPVQVQTDSAVLENQGGIFSRLMTSTPDHLNVAFVHQGSLETSNWIKGHEKGRLHLEQALPGKVTTRSYFHADSPEQAAALLKQAVSDGAQVVFTTTPPLSRPTLKAAVTYPKVRFLNCSVNIPYTSIRTYYSRVYEGKFITGAIAGAMAQNDRIGYVGSYPIFGVPASINAFALGAQMTNPRVKIDLRWSCQQGNPIQDFIREGIRVISNKDVPLPDQTYLEFGEYGTYLVSDNGTLTPLGSPCWLWGRFYENVIRSILSGAWSQSKDSRQAVNYWWGMDSGVIDVKLSDKLPEGLRSLANMLRQGLQSGTLDPFRRRIIAQDGSLKNDGSQSFTPDVLLHMDWLCDNVEGSIPEFSQVTPVAQPLVRELGVYRDRTPVEPIEKESVL